MTVAYKILGQGKPSASTSLTLNYANLCDPTGGKNYIVSSVVVCNYGSATDTVSLFVSPKTSGGGISPGIMVPANAIAINVTIPPYSTEIFTLGLTLEDTGNTDTTCRLKGQSHTTGTTTFTAFGSENY